MRSGPGVTDRYAVIGNPVAHSKSPWIHARFARQTGEDIDYRALAAPLEGFARVVHEFRSAGGKGANVTLPFKQEAFRLAGTLSERARAARAVNTLLLEEDEIRGDNTDGIGIVRDLLVNAGFMLAGSRVLLMGAGGAAQGVLLPLLEAAPAALVIANRTVDKARALAARFPGVAASAYPQLAGERFDLVINATSAGLNDALPDALPPLPPALFRAGALAYEMVYGRDTAFMRYARREGAARVVDGLGMLVEQAAESFFLWRGVRPATQPVLAALRGA